jgi:dephospho-CoA kinase
MILGLTGGMGCGKTTAARLLGELGARVIEADALVSDLYAHDREVRAALRRRHGPGIFDPSGELDRKQLAAKVFADPAELAWLEELIHPRVRTIWLEQARREPERWSVVEIPLLFEKGLEIHCTVTVCLVAQRDVQRRRLLERGISDEEMAARMARQWPLAEKMKRADHVISNSGSLEMLKVQLRHLWSLLPA